MKIKLVCVGKTGKDFLEKGEEEYIKRLIKYVPFEKIEIPDIKNAKKAYPRTSKRTGRNCNS